MVNFSKPQSMMTMLVTLFALLHVSVALQHGASQQHAARSADAALEARINDITDELQKRQSTGTIAITGPCGADGACGSGRTSYPRLEIRELNKNADQWNLYILGMERFQAMDKNDPLSYYQIAAVHGRPYRTWNNFPTPLVNQAGFCPHSNVLFGSWHRPYLAVFEVRWIESPSIPNMADVDTSKRGTNACSKWLPSSHRASGNDGRMPLLRCACHSGTGPWTMATLFPRLCAMTGSE